MSPEFEIDVLFPFPSSLSLRTANVFLYHPAHVTSVSRLLEYS